MLKWQAWDFYPDPFNFKAQSQPYIMLSHTKHFLHMFIYTLNFPPKSEPNWNGYRLGRLLECLKLLVKFRRNWLFILGPKREDSLGQDCKGRKVLDLVDGGNSENRR